MSNNESNPNVTPASMVGASIVVGIPGTGIEIKDVCEKVGSIFGETGREIGRKLDEATRDVKINIGW